MKVLIVGYGSHAKKRIVPALIKCKDVTEIDIFLRNQKNNLSDDTLTFRDFNLYENKKRQYDYIVISSPPFAHKDNLITFKENSNNFIIEKPIFDELNNFKDKQVINIFNDKNIYEGLMYLYHPLWSEVKKIFQNEKVLEFSSTFTIPHIEKTNYRYFQNKGGGFTLDLGIYPISLFFNLIAEDFKIIRSNLTYEKEYEVDIAGELEINYGDNITYKAKWGAGLEYTNNLEIKTIDSSYVFPFIFTKNDELESYYIKKNKTKEIKNIVGNYDQFKLMYETFFSNNIEKIDLYDKQLKIYKCIFDVLNNK